MDIRLVFMGTPEFAVPALLRLETEFQIIGVITQPDRPSGRGRKMISPPVKSAAETLDLDIYQPADINSNDSLEKIFFWEPDVICVAAFGQILSPEVLGKPTYGCLNLHASLLPRWRGASPINAAILAGDQRTGVSIMKMAEGLDDGPILSQKSIPIKPDDTAGSLSDQLSALGAALLVDTIPPYIKEEILPKDQDPSLAGNEGHRSYFRGPPSVS